MQQAKRWRRKPGSWQIVLARWLLAVAVVVSLSPSTSSTAVNIARAQDRGSDEPAIGRSVTADDTYPEHATTDDGLPAPPPSTVPITRPLFAPNSPATVSQPAADEPASARVEAMPDEPSDAPPPSTGDGVPSATGNSAATIASS
jgi:hypothetical protein